MLEPDPVLPCTSVSDGLVIHFQDEHLLIVEKPAGLLTVPGRGPDKQHCLISMAMAQFSDALIVHRLDMATSGLVILARGKWMQQQLSQLFASRHIHKQYHAVVQADAPAWIAQLAQPDDWFDIHLPLIADWPNRPRQKVDWVLGKPSHTRVKWLSPHTTPGTSRVLLEPVTGRSHQLRVHMLSWGHPIVGDDLYAPSAPQVDGDGLSLGRSRLHLHASAIALTHPATGQRVTAFSAPPFFADHTIQN